MEERERESWNAASLVVSVRSCSAIPLSIDVFFGALDHLLIAVAVCVVVDSARGHKPEIKKNRRQLRTVM